MVLSADILEGMHVEASLSWNDSFKRFAAAIATCTSAPRLAAMHCRTLLVH